MKPVNKVKIRMYRHGLGDCFLLTFYLENRKNFNLLIDCGVLSKAKEYKDKMIEVAENIKDATGNTIDILVATHEHWDHLSGFLQAQTIFDSMTIKKIWMSWAENPDDEFAKMLKESQAKKLNAIKLAYDSLKSQIPANYNLKQKEGLDNYLNAFNSFFNFFGLDSSDIDFNLNSTGDALDILKKRKTSEKEYLTPGSNEVKELTELPGVRFYVLGPPKDVKALKKMNPSKVSSEIYELDYGLAMGESFISALNGNEDKNKPFDRKYWMMADKTDCDCGTYNDLNNEWRKIDDDWLFSAGNLAIALDSAVNNTCLVLAVELVASGKVLLFPADAQIGNWLSWSNYKWNVKNNDEKVSITIDDILSRTVFYKVGHHGSHNATMKEHGLEKMDSQELIAMIPVDQEMARTRKWKMPFQPLLEALNEKAKGKVILMDEKYPDTIKSGNKARSGNKALYYDVVIQNK